MENKNTLNVINAGKCGGIGSWHNGLNTPMNGGKKTKKTKKTNKRIKRKTQKRKTKNIKKNYIQNKNRPYKALKCMIIHI